MKRYARTLWLFWTTALSAEMEYRSNFILACFTSFGHLAGSIFSVWIFFRGQKAFLLGGYNLNEAMLVMGYFTLMLGLANTVFRQNLSRIVQHVRSGTLDYVLLKPMDSQFWLSFRNCSPWGLPNIALGAGVIFYNGQVLGLSAADYAMGAFAMLCGSLILYSLWFILGSLSIWFVKVHNITHVLYQMLESGRYPVTAYGHFYKIFLTFVIPISFLTTFPAEVMTGNRQFAGFLSLSHEKVMLASMLIGLVLLGASRFFWRFALRHYTSASS